MAQYHNNDEVARLALTDPGDNSHDTDFDAYGAIVAGNIDGLLAPFAETVPFADVNDTPPTPQTIQNLANVGIAIYYHNQIKTKNVELMKNLKDLWVTAFEAAKGYLRKLPSTPTAMTALGASWISPLINEDDYNGTNSDVGLTI